MKVLVVGFSKTGTKTMHAALKMLGYSIYDYEHNFYYLRDDWKKILTKGGTKEDFYRMYKDVDCSMDIPIVVFWEELLEAFPDCKLIHVERKDEEDWMRSWQKQTDSVKYNYTMKLLTCFSPTAFSIMSYSRRVARCVFGSDSWLWFESFQGISPTVAKKRYRDHNTSVRNRAPKDQLLEFKMSDGWKPLCKFLGKPIPDQEFPHKNKGASILEDWLKENPVFLRMKLEMKIAITVIVALAAVGYYFFM